MSGGSRAKVVALAALTVGCPAPSGSERLEGRWIGLRAEGTTADTLAAANACARDMELDFHRDALTVKTTTSTQSGRYRVVRRDAAKVVITSERDGPGQEQTFLFANEGTMRWRSSMRSFSGDPRSRAHLGARPRIARRPPS